MKKIVSMLLSLVISTSAMLFISGSIYSAKAEEISINSFIESGVKLIRENDVGKEFVPQKTENEKSEDTAVINDLPDEFYDYMRYLYADVVGFNRVYQWYGSYSSKNTGGIPIEGANERKFVPKDNDRYPYYYCVVTSTDVGYDPIVIRTGASRYMEFN